MKTDISLPVSRLAELTPKPLQTFVRLEAAGGIVLLLAALVALIWVNSPWSETYHHFWEKSLTIGVGQFAISKLLHEWINEGLMVLFFMLVGLEIKREFLVGELATRKQAMLPLMAALGGMLFPAGIYLVFNFSGDGSSGWGIPLATDIAFALGVMSLLGNLIPNSLKVFLTSLAIFDDIGAVLVIALFYTKHISWLALAAAVGILLVLVILNRVGIRKGLIYGIFGVAMWFAFLKSGIHTTVAGVLLAFTIPARTRIDPNHFLSASRNILKHFEKEGEREEHILANEGRQACVHELKKACYQIETPLQRIEHALHPWVTFAVVPLFALANAGVEIGSEFFGALTHPITIGVVMGLVIGKPLGIALLSWLSVKTGMAALPENATWRHIVGLGCLGGIGFTMALFIGNLAFPGVAQLEKAKFGILLASLATAVIGWAILRTGAQNE